MNSHLAFIKYILFSTALSPLVVFSVLPFPYNSSKVIFLNAVIEVALAAFILYGFFNKWNLRSLISGAGFNFLKTLKHPLFVAVLVLFSSITISTFFAYNQFKAFWSMPERGDGFYSLSHYLIFFVLTTLLFLRDDWQKFFKVSVVVAAIVIFFAWMQFFGSEIFPFFLKASTRPGSSFDNPAYLASYLVFILAIATMTAFWARRGSFWRFFGMTVATLSLITIFVANVRGVILGVVSGLVFFVLAFCFKNRSAKLKRVGIIILASILLFTFIFVASRKAVIWQSIPGLDRLATVSLDDSSAKTRLIALGSSFAAFKERPILGWGLENYNVAYNKHYNPTYAQYEETWFDRAHNKLAEMAVTQGAFGVLAYLMVFFTVFFVIFRKVAADRDGAQKGLMSQDKRGDSGGLALLVLAATTLAHFVQNIFLFDTPVGHLMFFSTVGFILFLTKDRDFENRNLDLSPPNPPWFHALNVLGILIVLIIFFNLYFYAFVPYRQALAFRGALATKSSEEIALKSKSFLEPYNYFQSAIRFQFLEAVVASDLRKPESKPVADKAVQAMEDLIEKEPSYDPRYYIFLGEAYNIKGKDDPVFLKKSEFYLREALKLAPRRQDIYYLLAYSLAGQGRSDEAVGLMRGVVALSPNVARAHYNLGLELAIHGQDNWEEVEVEFGKALDIGFVNHMALDIGTVSQGWIGVDYYNMEIIYKQMLSVYVPARDKVRVVRIAERLKQINSDPVILSDLDSVKRLAEDGAWDVLIKSLIEPLDN
ncbi:MAG: Uncharacterized protein G01um101420_175 [Parcubacteria group bacterium Gr01-1014_20]|nr:MAG: Uncharacterized protein G01um101420_175 [Parcubacteria group bacterium Gr01-1014_20]